MATLPGIHCATALASVGLSFTTIVRALMDEVGLPYEEAARTARFVDDHFSRC